MADSRTLPGTVVVPTFTGHLDQALSLVRSIRRTQSAEIHILLVLSADDAAAFEDLARSFRCEVVFIEDLVEHECGKRISGRDLLKLVGKFRYQALKKLLGIARSPTELVLVLDSETQIHADLVPLFDAGIEQTTVLTTQRPWAQLRQSLTSDVFTECNHLLPPTSLWYFESFNWLYSRNLAAGLLTDLKTRFGGSWMFRPKPLFECQLYFQFAHQQGAAYRFIAIEQLLRDELGDEADTLLRAHYTSYLQANGVFEYMASALPRQRYEAFISRPSVMKHLRIPRHEPSLIYDVVNAVRERATCDPNYYGVASMHRGEFMQGRIAVLLSGVFHGIEDVRNARAFLAGVDCDVFVAIESTSVLAGAIQDLINPVAIVRVDDERATGDRNLALQMRGRARERHTPDGRDFKTMGMFDKIAAAFSALRAHEASTGTQYEVVVRLRPDLLSLGGLRGALLEIAERGPALAGRAFFPNIFWSQGINDQFFLGTRAAMGSLLSHLDAQQYATGHYMNPEYHVGDSVLSAGLVPVAFQFDYLLTRGRYPELRDISSAMEEQQRHFWSRPIDYPSNTDLSVPLAKRLANVRIKNSALAMTDAWFRGRHLEYIVVREEKSGQYWTLISDLKSPDIFAFRTARGLVPIASYFIAAGFYVPHRGQSVELLAYDADRKLLAFVVQQGLQTLVLSAVPCDTRPSLLLATIRFTLRALRKARSIAYRGARRTALLILRRA